ncbi:hypothetical protein GCM10027589_41720 [Actinocorallia lasiicapitis]
MADVQRRFVLRHLRSAPTTYVRHLRSGKLAHEGVGIAFWFRPLSAVISEVPVDDRELPMLFHGRSHDFQDLSVQATVTYRIVDPAVTAQRIDFAVSPDTGRWQGTPLDQVAAMLTETAQQHALRVLAGLRVREAVVAGPDAVRAELAGRLSGDERLAATGISVIDVRVVAVRPEAEVERALQTPAREEVQQEADRATYERRATAVERERTIAENEMQSKIELAHREENLVAQRNQNARRTAEGAAEAARVEAESQAARNHLAAELDAETARIAAQARSLREEEAAAVAVRIAVVEEEARLARERRAIEESGESQRLAAVGRAERDRIGAEALAAVTRIAAAAEAERIRVAGAAEAEALAGRLAAHAGVDPRVLLALAAQSVAENLPEIGQLTLTPDLLSQALTRLSHGDSGEAR